MRFYIAVFIGFIIGFFICAIFASTKMARLEALHDAAERVVKEAIRVGDYLCLWDDHEFDELRETIEKYEEE